MAYVEWTLKSEAEKKIRRGHPWIFSNDLDHSPGRIEPGAWVRLRSRSSEFLAWGYGHPNSLISFRVLSREPADAVWSLDSQIRYLSRRLSEARLLRQSSGLDERFSFRLIFGEADGVPGLIIDVYRLLRLGDVTFSGPSLPVLAVVQSSTAGADRLIEAVQVALETELKALPYLGMVLARDSSARKMEGIANHPREFLRTKTGVEGIEGVETLDQRLSDVSPESWSQLLAKAEIAIEPSSSHVGDPVSFQVDFIGGQKTGFFLDQRANTKLLCSILRTRLRPSKPTGNGDVYGAQSIKVLDLFCYVGQWSAQIAKTVSEVGCVAECDLFDASSEALALASRNVQAAGGRSAVFCRDVLRAWEEIAVTQYDVVICDPPALVKKKKDIAVGSAAYVKQFRESIRRVKSNGVIVLSSCSGLIDEASFREILEEAVLKSGRSVSWIAHGGHSPDHPWLTEFSQGRYLKAQIGIVREKL